MKQFLAGLLVFGALGSAACGSDDKGNETVTYEAACQSGAAAVCSKVYSCNDNPPPLLWGHNEADCRTKLEQNQNCEKKQCPSGTTYNQAKAQECLDQYRSLTCDQASSLIPPAACNAICQ